jgi:hypothetical protein
MQSQTPEKMLAALRHSIALLQSDKGANMDWYKVTSSGTSRSITVRNQRFKGGQQHALRGSLLQLVEGEKCMRTS